ncbi:uncharacterized protein PV09_08514 [Verruconis gallopava]|uniref:Cyclin-dependent kinase n=1 Tax=Verruconis gallopava TaxID=253628 RepID=A0A0D1XC59_9PEZI|nr:uncharacterized protein PV09_08514 [Verruconis gallopava]KIV99845.1 hypothetical protein PV09_08514 [Verruconis gallopava]
MATAEVHPVDRPAEVANKVLRRAQVSKMTRALQDRLALANIKVKQGWEKYSIETLEPKIELELKRKRPASSNGAPSDTSSSVSERYYHSSRGVLDSSPLTGPMFSDDFPRSGSSYGGRKRARYQQHPLPHYPASSNHARVRVKGMHHKSSSWKSNYRLPESSPAYHSRHVRYSDSHVPRLSFISETSTVAERSPSPTSEQDDEDLPVMSFQTNITSSPPQRILRTPSPDIARSARLRSKPFPNAHVGQDGEDSGADLLMFLAASPSPAVPRGARTPRLNNPPSTPPPKSTPLPSSMMNTPGGSNAGFLGFGTTTPGPTFNFSDYLNVTPSPAQAAWRTPAASKTPLTARAGTRRRLNFDNLMPPSSGESPRIGHDSKLSGLGMELGGELVSSQ